MRASRARGAWSFLHRRNRATVDRVLATAANKHGVRLYRQANVGNHIHLLFKTPTRESAAHFLRAVSGTIARRVTGARKGHRVGRFWDALAFSRLVTWGREFMMLGAYFRKNELEAFGFRGAELKVRGDDEAVVVVGDENLLGPGGWAAQLKGS